MTITQPTHRTDDHDHHHDRDAERLAHQLFIERQRVFPETPEEAGRALGRTLERLQDAVRRLGRRLAAR